MKETTQDYLRYQAIAAKHPNSKRSKSYRKTVRSLNNDAAATAMFEVTENEEGPLNLQEEYQDDVFASDLLAVGTQEPFIELKTENNDSLEQHFDWQFIVNDQTGKPNVITEEMADFYVKSYLRAKLETQREKLQNQQQFNWTDFVKFSKSVSKDAAPFEMINATSKAGQMLLDGVSETYTRLVNKYMAAKDQEAQFIAELRE